MMFFYEASGNYVLLSDHSFEILIMKSEETIAGRMKKYRLLLLVLLMLTIAALFSFYQQRTEHKAAAPKKGIDRIPVSVALVSKAAIRDSFSTVGTVEAFREADIFSESSGLVRKVAAEPGDAKKPGEALFVVDDELAAARQRRAEAHYRQAKRDVERYGNLYKEGAVPLSAYEAVQLQHEEAEAEFVVSSRKFSDTKIKAPFAGTLTSRFVEQGELVHEGMKVAHLVDMSRAKVIIFVPEQEIGKFVSGSLLKVTSDLYPDQEFSGRVATVSDKSGREHTFRVEVVLENTGKIRFRSGMFARVNSAAQGKREVLLLPRVALVSGIRMPEVFVVRNGEAFLRPFVAGIELQKDIVILDGLSAGESVVTSGQSELRNGSAVTVIAQKEGSKVP